MDKLNETLSGKNINFLIGSGASCPAYKTLSLGENKPSLEDLLSSENIDAEAKKVLYYFYFRYWIFPMTKIIDSNTDNEKEVLKSYKRFLKKLISFLNNESNEKPKRINIFTTNYDLMFEKTFQDILNEKTNCYFNDGSSGFIDRTLNAQNFNLSISRTGYLDKYKNEVPTINLIKLHGSISWNKAKNELIGVSYNKDYSGLYIENLDYIDFDNEVLNLADSDNYHSINEKLLKIYTQNQESLDKFYEDYKSLSIINPNKWKFYETVFEQHYYQQLRNFSYELEKDHTILIVFGFSFADEHIKEVFERALTNPTLKVYIISYSEDGQNILKSFFKDYKIDFLPDFKQNKNGVTISGDFSYLNSLFGDSND